MKNEERNDPSRYRALVREAKAGRGRHPGKLLNEARRLGDPYFASLALFDLSADPRLKLKGAASAAEEALLTAGRVERLWRRAEVLTIIARKVGSWRGREAAQSRDGLLDGILDAVLSMPEGKGLSDGITGCAPRLGCGRLGPLLAKAVVNRGFESTGARAVIRQWVQKCGKEGPAPEDILDALAAVEDGAVRSKLMGYLHLQCKKSERCSDSVATLRAAVETAVTLGKEERLDALRYLAGQSSTGEELEIVAGALEGLDDPASRARLMATLGGSADRAGLGEMAVDWFKDGLKVSSQVEDRRRRGSIRLNLAQGFERCGESELARQAHEAALKDRERRVEKSERGEVPEVAREERSEGPNDLLALYDTYEGGLKPVHLRAVARAAPLCAAFGLDLALMGFPTEDLEGLINAVITDTGVGRGGKYLRELTKQGRVVLVSCTSREPPEDWKKLGLPVATTSHPGEDKRIGMAEAIRLARSQHPLQQVCLIMGLGKRGLPPSLLDAVQHHLELTGRDVPLETCTAMGVIAAEYKNACIDEDL